MKKVNKGIEYLIAVGLLLLSFNLLSAEMYNCYLLTLFMSALLVICADEGD